MCVWTSFQVCLHWHFSCGLEHALEANLVALTYCVPVHSTERSQGRTPDFYWQEQRWRMRSRRPSTLQPLIAVTAQRWWVFSSQRWYKAKPLRHLVWTDAQLFLSADLLLLHHSACNDGSESRHTLFKRLSSFSVAKHHFWACQLLSDFAGFCIWILMTDLTLVFSNVSGFIRSNSGSRAA